MKRITVDEEIYDSFNELCSTYKVTQEDMLLLLIDSYSVEEKLYARFKELCRAKGSTQADMLETLIDGYASTSAPNEELVERISSLEIELLELRNQLIS